MILRAELNKFSGERKPDLKGYSKKAGSLTWFLPPAVVAQIINLRYAAWVRSGYGERRR
jgi:hypothetical protein